MKRNCCPTVLPEEFRRRLLSEYGYRTREAKERGTVRFPSWRYHAVVFRNVWQGAALARRGQYDRHAWETSSANILLTVESLGGRLEIEGLKPLATLDRPCIIAANHMSALETHALASILLPFRNVTFVVKRSLLHYPFFGAILRNLEPIALTRVNPREDLKILLRQGAGQLKAGISLILFPQARRHKVFNPETFNSIAVKLAGRMHVPIVPLALKTDFLGLGFPLPEVGKVYPHRTVRFGFGPVVEVENREKQAHRETMAFISERLRHWNAKIRPDDKTA